MSSSCAAALLAGTGGQAFAQDAPRLWGAWGELGAQAGAETNAFLEGFMPLGQDADSIIFLDMRLDYGVNSRGSTSIGLGVREIVGPDLILGANAFVDAVRTENGNTFAGATLGLEAFTSIFDLRVNAHVPIGGGSTLAPIVTGTGVSVVANQLVENRTRTNRKEGLLYGLTGEIGAMFDSPFADNQRLRAYAGGYIYDRSGYNTEAGGRLGLEYQINDVLSLAGSRFTLGAELVYDKDDKFDAIASARLRIPLFAGDQTTDANGESRLSAIQQRMDEGVRRDKGIRVGTQSSTTAVNGVPVINPATGVAYGGIYYADQAGGGTGDFADPTALATAVANAGVGGIVVALGGGGPITTAGITLQSGQTLIGGGESIQVQLADGSTTNFLLSGTNGTIDGDPGVTTVTLASGVTIRDLTIQGGTTVIGGNAVSNFTLTDLAIQNATDGISVTGAVNANVSNISFSGITGTSLFLNNQSASISNITINGGTNGVAIANNTGTTTLSGINVSNVSGDALTFTNNTGIINVTGFTATNTGDDAIAVTGGGTFGFTGTTTLNGLGAGATSDGIDLSGTSNATLTFGDVDVTGLGGGTGVNMAGADATLTMQSLDVTGTGVAGSKGVDLSGTQNGRTVTITNGGTITNVDAGLVLGTNGGALAAPDAVFTWGGGDIGGLAYALDGVGVNAGNGSYAFGTTGFTGAFNFTTSGTPNYFVAATATGTGDGSSTTNRASIATAIGAAGGLGTVNFILINDGAAIDTSGATFALADNQTINTFGDGRTFTSAGLIIAANITGSNLPTGSVTITDPGSGAATLTNSAGAVSTIEVANGNAIRNITLGSTLGTALSGSGIAGLTIEGVTIGTGTDTPVNGIELTNTTGAVTLTNVDITNTTGTGLSLSGASGTVTGNNVDIAGANALSVTGGDAAVSFNASSSITNTSGTAVSISGRIGGSFSHFGGISSNGPAAGGISVAGATAASNVTFGGQVSLGTTTALGGGAGVDIDNNGQASAIAFTGGLGIATTGQTGFSAQGGGSVAIAATGGAETITTAGAMALSLSGIGTGTGGVNYDSIAGSGGGTVDDGISLTNLGAGSSISVTGTATLDNYDVNGIEISGLSNAGQTITFGTTTINQTASVAAARGIFIDTISATGVNIDFGATQIGAGTVTTAGAVIGNVTGAATGFAADFASLTTNRAQTGLLVDNVDAGTVGITGTALVQNAQTANISVQGSAGNVAFGGVVTTQNNSGFNGDHILLGTTAANGGTVTFAGQVTTTSTGSAGSGVTIGSGTASFNGGLAITTTSGTGLVGTGGTLGIANAGATSVAASAGQAVSLAGVNIATGGITFDSLSSSASGASGIALTGVTGDAFTVTGTTTVTNAANAGIALSGNAANVAFGATTVTASTTGNGVDVSGANTGTISFTDLDIALTGANTVAFDLNGAALGGAITANDFDVTSTSATGTIGVDLRGLTGGQTVRLGDPAAAGASSSIAGVETGVFLNATSNATFVYGDGEGAIDQGSTISATTAIDATNAPVAGTYNFQDVDFAGSPGAGFGIGTIYFVDSDGNATGGGDGSGSDASNPMTLAAAELAAGAGDIIVLIDDGSAITADSTNADNTLNLAANQQLLSFGDGAGNSQAVQVSLTVPPTVQLFSAGLTIADPTGGGAATLTTSTANDVVTLGGDGIRISGIDFEGNGTAARAINDAGGATGTVIERSSVSNFATVGIEITPSTNTTINDVDFSGNTGDILLNAAGSTLTNITSTGATGTAITLNNATGTTTLSNISITNAANGLSFTNASGTVAATNVDIAGGNALAITQGNANFTFDAASSIANTSGTAVSFVQRAGGSFTHAGTVVSNGATSRGIFSGFNSGAHSISFTGTVDFGTTTALGQGGVLINSSGHNVTVSFADLDIVTSAGLGLDFQTGGTLGIGTGTISSTNAQAVSIGSAGIAVGGINLTSLSANNVGGVGIGLSNVTGGTFTVSGTTSVSGTTGSAISATNVSSNMAFGTINLTLTSGDGLLLAGNSGTLTTGDMTIAMGTGGNGIRATGTNGDTTLGNVDITNVGAGTGLNLSGGTFDGQITFATLDITGTGTAGSKGIDLTGYDNTKNVVTTSSSAILNVETGLDLTNSIIGAGVRFQYGDGDAANPGTESKIDTTGLALVTTGMGTTGVFDLEDVEFGTVLGTTDISNLTGPVVFVVDQNNSSGVGSFTDPGSISEAAAATADVIVLIDTDTGTGTQTVNLGSALTLDDGQVLIGLDGGTTSIDVSTLGVTASGAPANILLTGLGSSSTITSTVTLDSNRLVLNSSTGNTVDLAGSAGIQNVAITNTGTGDGIAASFSTAESVTIRSSSIGGGTGGFAIDLATTSGASSFDFSNLALTSGLRLDGSGGGSLSGTMTGTNTIAGATGQAIALNAVTLDPGGMTFDTISANGGGTVGNGIVLNDLGSGSGFSVTGTTTLDNYTGFGIEIGNLSQATQTIAFGAVNINTTVGQVDSGGDGLSIDTISATDVNIDFGAVTIGNATDPSGTGAAVATITNAATGFDLDFASLDLANVALGFTVDGFDAPGASTVTVAGTTNITANTFDAIRIINSDGDVTFGGRTTITNSGAAAGADGVDLGANAGGANTGAYTFNGVDITVNGTGAFGFRATNSGTVTINDPSSNNQITSNNGTALYINPTQISLDLQSVTSSNATGSGVFIDGGDAVGGAGATAVDIATLNVTGSTGAGLRITNSTGTFNIGATTINNAGSSGGGVDLDLGAGDTATVNFTGALDIDTNAATGFDANGTGGASLTVNVSGTGTQAINTATGQILSMNQVIIGSGVSFDTLAASGTVAGDAVTLADVDGGTFNGGNVSVAGTSGVGDGIEISGGSSATFSFSSATIDNAASFGLLLDGANGGVTFTTVDIDRSGGPGVRINGNTNAVNINGGSIGASNDPAGEGVYLQGGSGAITIESSIAKTSFGSVVRVQGRTGGTVTFSGNLSATGGTDNGIFVDGNSGGTINFSGGTKTLTTGASTAVSLTNNTGTTVNFSTGGLNINTTSGTGFLATGGGAVNVSGGSNTISTGSGGLISANNVTFGATFASATATGLTGTTDGVNLTNTSGSLTVQGGTVTNTGSGQAIQVDGGTLTLASGQNVVSTGATSNTLDIRSVTGGSNTFSGSFTDAGGTNGGGIFFTGNSGGSTTFTGDVRIDSGNQTALTTSNSPNHGITFNGTNTDIDSSGGANAVVITGTGGGALAFNSAGTNTITATGGGSAFNGSGASVTVTGTANVSVASPGGTTTAVSVTGTIGSGGVTFESVTQNGGDTAIFLSNTGSAGGFTVTGDGTTTRNNSGGTIQNTSGNAIRLINTADVSLNHLTIESAGANGIFGSAVDGFALRHSTVRNNGNQVDEGQLRFADTNPAAPALTGGTGTFVFDNILVEETAGGNDAEHLVEFINTSGTMNLTIQDSTFQGTSNSAIGADGFLIETRGTAVSTVTATGSTFQNNFTQGFQGSAIDSSSLTVNIGTSTIRNNNEGIVLSAASNADLAFDINNNTEISGHTGTSIFVGTTSTATASSSVTGRIRNNSNIVHNSINANGIIVYPSGDATATVEIDNNTISGTSDFRMINVTNTDNNGDFTDLAITITNNNVTNTNNITFGEAIYVEGRRDATVCAAISNNTVSMTSAQEHIRLRERDASTVTLEVGTANLADPVNTVLGTNNPGSSVFDGEAGVAIVGNGSCRTVP